MKLTRRFLALLLALSMSLSMVTPAYASEAEIIDETEPAVVLETEAAPVETTEAETEVSETEAPAVVETEAPAVEETEAPEVIETEAAVVETEPVVEETEPVTASAEAANETEVEIITILDENAETENVVEFTMTVPAGASVTYQGRVSGMILTIYASDVTVENNGETYVSEWGSLEATISGGDFFNPPTIVVTNTSAEDAVYEAQFTYPMGDMMNPQYMYGTGVYAADLAADDNDGYYYTFEVDTDATLFVKINTITEGVAGDVVITNDATYAQKSILADGTDGVLELTVAAGETYTIQAMAVPGEDYTVPAAYIEWEINYPLGTELNPAELTWNDEYTVGTGTFEVPADVEAYYVTLGRANGMILSINGGEPVEQVAEHPMMPIVITLEGGQTYELVLSYPVGNPGNPDTLWGLGTYTTSLEEGDSDGYTYSYTADVAGTVYVSIDSIPEGVEGDVVITKGYTQWSLYYEGVDGVLPIELAEGDELTIQVSVVPVWEGYSQSIPAADIEWTINFPAGSELNPIYPEWQWNDDYTEADFTVTVPAGAAYLVRDYSIAGMELSINGAEPQLMVGAPRQPIEFTLDNTAGTEAVEYALHVAWPSGTFSNPETLWGLGTNWTSVAEGDQEGYYYSFTVEHDGTLYASIDEITEGVTGNIIINNNTSYANMNLVYDGVDGVVAMDVAAGDELVIQVMAEPDTTDMFNWVYPAADITWSINYAYGSELNPIFPEFIWNETFTEATTSVIVPAGETYHFAVYASGMLLSINGGEATELVAEGIGRVPAYFTIKNSGAEDAEYVLTLTYPVGSRENPELVWDVAKIVANLAKGDSDGYYYSFMNRRAEGTLVFSAKASKKNIGFDVILSKEGDYAVYTLSESENGKVAIDIQPGDLVTIQVVAAPDKNWNYPAAKITLTGEIEYPLGSQMNPASLTVGGNNAAVIKEGNAQGYIYNWTAPMDGELLVSMGANETGWMYAVNNLTAGIYGDMMWSDMEDSDVYIVPVNAGDKVEINVNTYDPMDMWNIPAGTVNFFAEFTASTEITSGKSITLKFIDPATGKSVSGSKVNWTIDGVYVFDPNGEEIEYTDTSAYATIKNGKLSTFKCGDRVNVIVKASMKADPSVVLTYHVVVLPASNIMSIWNTWYETDEYGNIIAEHREPVMGNWIWNANGVTEEEVPYMGWDLDAFSYPSNSSQEVIWKTSNKKVATIDENGHIGFVWNAKKGTVNTGTVTITATAADGSGKKASFKLTVTADKFPDWMELVRVDGKAFEQGEYLYDEEVYNPETDGWEMVPVYEKILYIAPGETIKLKANIDPTAGKKYQTSDWGWWGDVMFTMKKLSGNQYSVTAKKDAHDGAWCYVNAYVPYCGSEEIKVVVKSPVTKKLEICWLGEDYYEPITWNPSFDIHEFDFESEDGWNSIMMKAVLIGSDGSAEVVDADWITSNKKVAAPEEFSWDEMGAQYNLTGKLGSFKATASYKDADGKTYQDSVTFEIVDMSKWVNSLEITAPEQFMGTTMDFVEVWVEDEFGGYWEQQYMEVPAIYISAGQSVKLTAKVNASAKNKKVAWNCYVQEYNGYFDENVKISKSGKLTIGKNVPEQTMFYVECWPTSNNTVGSVRIPVIVLPRATNVHARIVLDGKLMYASNTTRDWSVAEDGEKVEISALVYPFDASQDVTWTSSNKKVAQIVTETDAEGVVHTYIVFTPGAKAAKVKFTATANDGSKEKATFTLNISK